MKRHLVIPVLCLLVITVAGLYNAFGFPADPPTAATSPAKLKPVALPADLPELLDGLPAEDESHAAKAVEQILASYHENPNDAQAIMQRTALLLSTFDGGHPRAGFMDAFLPIQLGVETTTGGVISAMLEQSRQDVETRASFSDAERLSRLLILFELGHHLFAKSDRVHLRSQGLALMNSAGNTMYRLLARQPSLKDSPVAQLDQKLLIWSQAISATNKVWAQKISIVLAQDPHRGDLMNIAEHELDLSVRTEAVLRLGLFQHAPKSKGNGRKIRRLIDRLLTDEFAEVRSAAAAAKAFNRADAARFR